MQLIILGAGGYGQTVADLARQTQRYGQVSFLDDNSIGNDVVGTCAAFQQFNEIDTEMYPAFGNNQIRTQWIEKLMANGIKVATIIHHTAYVSPTAHIEPGCIILPNATVGTNCILNYGCIVNCGAILDHGTVLAKGVHVCLGAIVKADNFIPAGIKIEAGQVIERETYKGENEHDSV